MKKYSLCGNNEIEINAILDRERIKYAYKYINYYREIKLRKIDIMTDNDKDKSKFNQTIKHTSTQSLNSIALKHVIYDIDVHHMNC